MQVGDLTKLTSFVTNKQEQHESNSRVDGSVTAEDAGEGAAIVNASTNGRSHAGAELGYEQDNNDKVNQKK